MLQKYLFLNQISAATALVEGKLGKGLKKILKKVVAKGCAGGAGGGWCQTGQHDQGELRLRILDVMGSATGDISI